MISQITSKIIMVRPANFGFNPETAINNTFQTKDKSASDSEIANEAVREFDAMVELLSNNGIDVTVWQDTEEPKKPDAIFPNNWFTTHQDDCVITYPMFAELRRSERREDLIESIMTKTTKRYSFEQYEANGQFLEGTGSMILDREYRRVYACLSERTDVELLAKFGVLRGYKVIHFNSVDQKGNPIYHTNVMMGLGEQFCAICLDSILDEDEKNMVVKSLEATGKEIVDLSYSQINHFAGNLIQLKNKEGKRFIIMSRQAKESLKAKQLKLLSNHGEILAPDITVIENTGGGSARCMIAENFLPISKY